MKRSSGGRRPLHIALLATLLVVAGTLGILACGGSSDSDPRQTALRVALATFGGEVLDPSMDSHGGLNYHGPMFDHLLGVGPDGRQDLRLGLLAGWEMGPSGETYSLSLREGLEWHDRVEVTADDIAFSMSHYSRDEAVCAGCSGLKEALARVEIRDRYSATLHLKTPDILFLGTLGPLEGDMPLLSGRGGDGVGGEGLEGRPLGTGPWRFAERVLRSSIDYDANESYWNRERSPGFERLHLTEVPEVDVRLAMLRSGIVDMAPVDVKHIEALRAEGFAIQGPRNVLSTAFRFFMPYDPNFLTSRVEFRRALILGMNLESIVGSIFPPEAATLSAGSALFNPVTEGYDPDLPPYPYDPEQAIRLLEEAEYRGGTVHLFSVTAYGLSEMPRINELVAEDWRSIGINVEVVPVEWPVLQGRLLARPQLLDDVGPAPILHGAAPTNRPGGVFDGMRRYITADDGSLLSYHDPENGSRILSDITALRDRSARAASLEELNRRMYEEYWAAPVFWQHEVYALSPDLTGWLPTDGTASDLRLETIRAAD